MTNVVLTIKKGGGGGAGREKERGEKMGTDIEDLIPG